MIHGYCIVHCLRAEVLGVVVMFLADLVMYNYGDRWSFY